MTRVLALKIAFRVCFTLFILAIIYIISFGSVEEWSVTRNSWLVRSVGYAALISFALSFSITPLNKLTSFFGRKAPQAILLAFRRAFGIGAACFAIIHAGFVIYLQLESNWSVFIHLPFFRAGLISLFLLLVLLITSFPAMLKLFRVKYWRNLHQLVFVIGIMIIQHVWLSAFVPAWVVLAMLISYSILVLLRFIPKVPVKKK
ncbi:MAG: hypothetical protein COA86_08375 [Kangiella sp.]|nr:MAG: hypothetical protein COA86_08375 [Kangiella sp.]